MSSSSSISSCSFALSDLTQEAYQLNVSFYAHKNQTHSQKMFTFKHSLIENNHELLDVVTKNGKCLIDPYNNLFSSHDVRYINKIGKLTQKKEGSHLLCLDLKHPDYGYLPPSSSEPVSTFEQSICHYFQEDALPKSSQNAKKVHSLFHSLLPLDYIFCEGSLKQDLLEKGGFSEKQIEFLNSSLGVESFCKCTEFFMNALKMGDELLYTPTEMASNTYIKPILKKSEAYAPHKTHSIYFPPQYKEMYAQNCGYKEALFPVFSAAYSYDNGSKVTLWSVEKKS